MASKDPEAFSDAFAQRLFVVTMIGCALYVAAVVVFIL